MNDKTLSLYVPAVTPFADDLSLDLGRLVAHARAVLDAGAHGLAPFGSTSEANSLTLSERMAGLEALIDGGIGADRIIPGTGCCALGDTIELTRHASDLGCKGALMLPPFFYKGVPDEGVYDAYARVIEAVGRNDTRIYLYHIPQMTGVPITLPLIDRLLASFGPVIAGLKDSSGKWENTEAVIRAFPQIDVYSASEAMIPQNAATGGAGCISASANVNPAGIRRLIDALGTEAEATAHRQVAAVRKLFESLPLIPAIKAAVAVQHDDGAFARVRPPLRQIRPDHDAAIAEAVALAAQASG
ncbi:dihydrodipicolinate synthase family protein [Palleronia abyssalis]|uniref:N-acetylneuraminate lyase n=1 Tax=Palleronia abyssalis TaxID=1501240 RepID=A0A2R8C0B8_9RHOB|nr:dihydrodipicolinate synthase family protein [Palleronia abyssalis]SPJ25823.1 N-acetylneuraminate lyase [Palleronia abyssalis]